MSASIVSVLAQCPYFQSLREEDLRRIAAAGRQRLFAAGEVLFREQEDCAGLALVLQGYVRLVRGEPGGREQILRRCGPGETLNDAPAFDGGMNAATALADGAASVWMLGHLQLQAVLHAFPGVAVAAVAHLAQRMRHLVDLAGDLALMPVPMRIGKLLVQLSDAEGSIPGDVTQQEIAEMTGTVRQVANRVIAEMAHAGILKVDHGRIRIVDGARLGMGCLARPPEET